MTHRPWTCQGIAQKIYEFNIFVANDLNNISAWQKWFRLSAAIEPQNNNDPSDGAGGVYFTSCKSEQRKCVNNVAQKFRQASASASDTCEFHDLQTS